MNMQGGKPGGLEILEEKIRARNLRETLQEKFSAKDLAGALGYRKVLYGMLQKRVKVLLLNSSYRRYPDANRVRKGISNVDFVVYRGFFMDEEAQACPSRSFPAPWRLRAPAPSTGRSGRWSGATRRSPRRVKRWRIGVFTRILARGSTRRLSRRSTTPRRYLNWSGGTRPRGPG